MGFTLIEMLVAVALVLLMMSMFAVIFGLASGSVHTQRGIAENDQRARSFVTVIRNDFKNRTFRVVTPFDANEAEPLPGALDFSVRDFVKREGYLYYSENNLNDDTDDVLQFTVKLTGTTGDFYYGKAATLALNLQGFDRSNEPDRDDGNPLLFKNGVPFTDNSSDSVGAEISYFLRHGRLYRRVLLLRDPLDSNADVQPTTEVVGGNEYFDPDREDLYPLTRNFWNDFDFSAHFGVSLVDLTTPVGARFHGKDDLSNFLAGTEGFPLGIPSNRFGHNHDDSQPREFVGAIDTGGNNIGSGNDLFSGRFTHQETSFQFFQYPQRASIDGGGNLINDGNPMKRNPSSERRLNLVGGIVSITNPGTVFNGPRRAEDLLLSNVHAFDVKLWDDAIEQFVDVGHNLTNNDGDPVGDFNANNNQHASDVNPPWPDRSTLPPAVVDSFSSIIYGPTGATARNRIFDTWHPGINLPGGFILDLDAPGMPPLPPVFPGNPGGVGNVNDPPPYRPIERDGGTPILDFNGKEIPKRLRAIQITIRYLDVSSNQLRQVTQQISLMD